MIRSLRAFFLSRLLREKLLLLAFIGIGTFWWLSAFTTRAGAFTRQARVVTLELADQRQWLDRREIIEADAQRAASRLDPARTRDRTQLLAEVSALANEAGIRNLNSQSQPSVTTGQFSIHRLNVTATNVEWEALRNFYTGLQSKAPYIGIDRIAITANAANRSHAVTLGVSSVEIAR